MSGSNIACTENGNINMTAADHPKRLGRAKGRSSGNKSDGLLAGVDNIPKVTSSQPAATMRNYVEGTYASTSSLVG